MNSSRDMKISRDGRDMKSSRDGRDVAMTLGHEQLKGREGRGHDIRT